MLASAAVFALTVVVFAPVRHHDFLQYDDNIYVTDNPHLKKHVLDLEGLRWPFVETYETNWIPLTWLSIEVDRALFGFDPGGYHATNVALHAASAALLLWVLAGATRSLGAGSFVAGGVCPPPPAPHAAGLRSRPTHRPPPLPLLPSP